MEKRIPDIPIGLLLTDDIDKARMSFIFAGEHPAAMQHGGQLRLGNPPFVMLLASILAFLNHGHWSTSVDISDATRHYWHCPLSAIQLSDRLVPRWCPLQLNCAARITLVRISRKEFSHPRSKSRGKFTRQGKSPIYQLLTNRKL